MNKALKIFLIIFGVLIIGLGGLIMFGMYSMEIEDTQADNQDVFYDSSEVKSILGVWTDGSGPNASIRVERDSIYDVEHFERTRYKLIDDSLIIYYDDEPFKAKIKKAGSDSLIYISKYGETRMWRFKE